MAFHFPAMYFCFWKANVGSNHIFWSFEMAGCLKFMRIYILWQQKWVFSYWKSFSPILMKRVVACLAVGTERMSYISFSHVRCKC